MARIDFFSAFDWLLILVACTSHCVVIVSHYMRYRTITRVSFTYPEQVTLPTVVACFEITPSANMNVKQQRKKFPSETNKIMKDVYTAQHINTSCKISMSDRSLCYWFPREPDTMHWTAATLDMYGIGFNVRSMRRSTIFYRLISPKQRNFALDDSAGYPVPPNKRSIAFDMTYRKTIQTLMQHPYDTNCYDYATRGLESQYHCLNECRKKWSSKIRIMLPLLVLNDTDLQNSTWLFSRSIDWKMTSEFEKNCRLICRRPECIKDSFEVIKMEEFLYNDAFRFTDFGSNPMSGFFLTTTSYPVVEIENRPKIMLTQLIMMLINTITFYTGLSVLDFLTRSVSSLVRFIKGLQFNPRYSRYILIILTLLLCATNVSFIALSYFRYETTSKISIVNEDSFSIPLLTGCRMSIFNWHMNMSIGRSIRIDKEFPMFPVAQVIDSFYVSFWFCWTFKSKQQIINRSQSFNGTIDVIRLEILKGHILDYSPTAWVIHDKKIAAVLPTFVGTVFKKTTHVVLSYSQFKTKLLEPPYDTQCRNYDGTPDSREDCINECLIERFLAENRSLCSQLIVRREYEVPFNAKGEDPTRDEYNCSNKCWMRDCVRNDYPSKKSIMNRAIDVADSFDVVTTRSNRDRTEKLASNLNLTYGRIGILEFVVNNDPVFMTESTPSSNFVSFLQNSLGALCFWTGLAPITLTAIANFLNLQSHMSIKKMRITFLCVVILLCSAAFVTESVTYMRSYFQYTTESILSLVDDNMHHDLGLTVCVQDKISRKIDSLQFIKNVRVWGDMLDTQDLITQSSRYFVGKLECLSYSFAEQLAEQDLSTVRTAVVVSLFDMFDSEVLLPALYISFQQNNSLLLDPASNIIRCHQETFFILQCRLSIRTTEKIQMPAPYDTMCRSYPTPKYNASRDCFFDCLIEHYKTSLQSIPEDIPTRLQVNVNRSGNLAFDLTKRKRVEKTCHSYCFTDCRHVIHTAHLESVLVFKRSTSYTVSIMRKGSKTLKLVYNAKLTLTDLLGVMFNGASFWLAFCPATIMLSKRIKDLIWKNKLLPGTKKKRRHRAWTSTRNITRSTRCKSTPIIRMKEN